MAITKQACLVCGLLVSLFACSTKLDPKAYEAWIRDPENGLHVSKPVGDFSWDVQYTPSDYVWLQRSGGQSGEPDEAARQEMARTQYYTLTIHLNDPSLDLLNFNVSNQEEKQRRLYYFSYQFQQDITLEQEGQSLPCVLYHFEKYSVNTSNSRTFVLGFENPKPDATEAKLVINSAQFGSLPVQIKVAKHSIPALQL